MFQRWVVAQIRELRDSDDQLQLVALSLIPNAVRIAAGELASNRFNFLREFLSFFGQAEPEGWCVGSIDISWNDKSAKEKSNPVGCGVQVYAFA